MSEAQMELFPAVLPDPRRAERLLALMQRERWRPDEVAYYLRCSVSAVYEHIDVGNVSATNIAREPNSRPLYRVFRDSVLRFESKRMEGGPAGPAPKSP
jgi:hypothetical protein